MKQLSVAAVAVICLSPTACTDQQITCRTNLDRLAVTFQDQQSLGEWEEVDRIREEMSRSLRQCVGLPTNTTFSGVAIRERDSYALTLLDLAIFADDAELVRYYLDQGVPIDGFPENGIHAYTGGTSLHVAALSASVQAADELLRAGADPSDTDDLGNTALFDSWGFVQEGLTLTQLLIDHGADLEHRNLNGVSALELAVRQGDVEKVRVLLANGADTGRRPDGTTLREFALSVGQSEIAELFR